MKDSILNVWASAYYPHWCKSQCHYCNNVPMASVCKLLDYKWLLWSPRLLWWPAERSAPGKGLFWQGWFPSVPWSPAYLVHTPAPHWTEAGCQSTEHVLIDTEAVSGPECRLCVVLWDLHNAQRCPKLTHCYLHYGGTRLRHDKTITFDWCSSFFK